MESWGDGDEKAWKENFRKAICREVLVYIVDFPMKLIQHFLIFQTSKASLTEMKYFSERKTIRNLYTNLENPEKPPGPTQISLRSEWKSRKV